MGSTSRTGNSWVVASSEETPGGKVTVVNLLERHPLDWQFVPCPYTELDCDGPAALPECMAAVRTPDLLIIATDQPALLIHPQVVRINNELLPRTTQILLLCDDRLATDYLAGHRLLTNVDIAPLQAPADALGKKVAQILRSCDTNRRMDESDGRIEVVDAVIERLINSRQRAGREISRIRRVLDYLDQGVFLFDRESEAQVYANRRARQLVDGVGQIDSLQLSDLLEVNERGEFEKELQSLTAGRVDSLLHDSVFSVGSDGRLRALVTLHAIEDQHNGLILAVVNESGALYAGGDPHHYDPLTGLPDRRRFIDLIAHSIVAASGTGAGFGLVLIDLDRFKDINDSFGHFVGDRLLAQVATAIKEKFGRSAKIGRLGGDEFALVVGSVNSIQAVEQIAGDVVAEISRQVKVDGYRIGLAASAGAALYPQHGNSAELLLRHAEIAMYVAKRERTGVVGYKPNYKNNKAELFTLENDLRQAIETDQLSLCYQPKVLFRNASVVGVEALARWHHPRRGYVPPDQFIVLAERSGLITGLTRSVIRKAIAQAVQWHLQGRTMQVAVNLSARNLQESELPHFVGDLLAQTGVPGNRLKFEVTESDLIDDPQQAIKIMEQLRQHGIEFSVDDFGTGYSSLAYLKKLQVDELKIDRGFVTQIDQNGDDLIIVHSTITMAHQLGIKVVAEGIENRAVWDLLSVLECDVGQGYFISRPLPAAELGKLIDKGFQQFQCPGRYPD